MTALKPIVLYDSTSDDENDGVEAFSASFQHRSYNDWEPSESSLDSESTSSGSSQDDESNQSESNDESTDTSQPTPAIQSTHPMLTRFGHLRDSLSRPPVESDQTARWPYPIIRLLQNYNPDRIQFPFFRHFGPCGCELPCRYSSCRNAKLAIFCTAECCPFGGQCGNGLLESNSLRLVKTPGTNDYRIEATQPIEAGINLGEYLGRLALENPRTTVLRNMGYRLAMVNASKRSGRRRICIDAQDMGSILRFLNHSCDATARFHDVCNGHHHTVVATTRRAIAAGDEVTVDYREDLWFVCRCGHSSCRHRFIRQAGM